MALADLLQQVLNFLIIGIVIVTMVLIISPLLSSSNMNVQNGFSDLCSQPGGVHVLQNLEYDEETSLIQFLLPESLLQDLDMSMTYPRNTFYILSALFDYTEGNVKSEVNSRQGLYKERKNSKYLEACEGQPCFCVVRTDTFYLSYEYLELTACFPRLYSYEPAHDYFNQAFNSLTDADYPTDFSKFEQTIRETLNYLETDDTSTEAGKIIQCYHLFPEWSDQDDENVYTFSYEGIPGQYFLVMNNQTNNILSGTAEDLEEDLSTFYELTKAGLFSEITTCIPLPDENNCYCPHIANFMTAGNEGLFLGIAGSKRATGINSINIDALTLQLNQGPAQCTISTSIN